MYIFTYNYSTYSITKNTHASTIRYTPNTANECRWIYERNDFIAINATTKAVTNPTPRTGRFSAVKIE